MKQKSLNLHGALTGLANEIELNRKVFVRDKKSLMLNGKGGGALYKLLYLLPFFLVLHRERVLSIMLFSGSVGV
jgi:hypothetical protein